MLECLLLSEGNWKRVYLMLWSPSLLLTQISWLGVLKWFLSIRVKISDPKPFRNSKCFVKYDNFIYIILIAVWLLLLTLSSFFMWCSDLIPLSKIIWELEGSLVEGELYYQYLFHVPAANPKKSGFIRSHRSSGKRRMEFHILELISPIKLTENCTSWKMCIIGSTITSVALQKRILEQLLPFL